jgi:hypothetical protein
MENQEEIIKNLEEMNAVKFMYRVSKEINGRQQRKGNLNYDDPYKIKEIIGSKWGAGEYYLLPLYADGSEIPNMTPYKISVQKNKDGEIKKDKDLPKEKRDLNEFFYERAQKLIEQRETEMQYKRVKKLLDEDEENDEENEIDIEEEIQRRVNEALERTQQKQNENMQMFSAMMQMSNQQDQRNRELIASLNNKPDSTPEMFRAMSESNAQMLQFISNQNNETNKMLFQAMQQNQNKNPISDILNSDIATKIMDSFNKPNLIENMLPTLIQNISSSSDRMIEPILKHALNPPLSPKDSLEQKLQIIKEIRDVSMDVFGSLMNIYLSRKEKKEQTQQKDQPKKHEQIEYQEKEEEEKSHSSQTQRQLQKAMHIIQQNIGEPDHVILNILEQELPGVMEAFKDKNAQQEVLNLIKANKFPKEFIDKVSSVFDCLNLNLEDQRKTEQNSEQNPEQNQSIGQKE